MKRFMLLPVLMMGASLPAQAEVRAVSDNGFNSFHSAEVAAAPAVVWKRLTTPKDWWNPEHSWSGSTAGFTMDAKAGGCFCELIQEKNAAGKIVTVGSVEHMRIIFYQPGKVLRLQGGLGPLQGEAVLGTLTVAMEPLKEGEGTKLSFSYSVGGYMRQKVSSIAGAVDGVLGEQFKRLIEPFSKPAVTEAKDKPWSLDLEGIGEDKPDVIGPDAEPVGDAVPEPEAKSAAKKPAAVKDKPKSVPADPEETR